MHVFKELTCVGGENTEHSLKQSVNLLPAKKCIANKKSDWD